MKRKIAGWTRRGYTAIEIGIVFGIVVIVAAIVIPHLMEGGRGRIKVSRVKADQRSLATAIESYFVDNKAYPAMAPMREGSPNPKGLRMAGGWELTRLANGRAGGASGLTTPISYITSQFDDPYTAKAGFLGIGKKAPWGFAYYASPDRLGWIVWSTGPDHDYDILDPATLYNSKSDGPTDALIRLTYDPTNGAESSGDVYRLKQ